MAKNAETFEERVEKKFVVPLAKMRSIVLDPNGPFIQRFEFDYIDDSYYNIMENVYFDDPDLSSYHEHVEGKPVRTKLRLRRYSPDGLPGDAVYFEVKTKKEGKTFKSRVKLHPAWVRPFLKDKFLPKDEFYSFNSDMKEKKIEKTMTEIIDLVHGHGFIPMLKSNYMRHAFKLRESDKVRLTMDRDIQCTRLFYGADPKLPYDIGLNDGKNVIVEVKVSDPAFMYLMEEFKGQFGESISVSKYCSGIYQTKNSFLQSDRDRTLHILESYKQKKTSA
ncbi:MAG: polyphosphate polymerase domain-containing protein [Oligoflexales bacterium]